MFVGKARTYPREAAFMSSTLGEATVLTLKNKPRQERLSSHKHSSLLPTFVNYDRKKFYNIGPGVIFITFSSQLNDWPGKIECYITLGLKMFFRDQHSSLLDPFETYEEIEVL